MVCDLAISQVRSVFTPSVIDKLDVFFTLSDDREVRFNEGIADGQSKRDRRRHGIPDTETYNDMFHNVSGSQYSGGSLHRQPSGITAPLSFPNWGNSVSNELEQASPPELNTL